VDTPNGTPRNNPILKHPFLAEHLEAKPNKAESAKGVRPMHVDPGVALFGSIGVSWEQKGLIIARERSKKWLSAKPIVCWAAAIRTFQRAYQGIGGDGFSDRELACDGCGRRILAPHRKRLRFLSCPRDLSLADLKPNCPAPLRKPIPSSAAPAE